MLSHSEEKTLSKILSFGTAFVAVFLIDKVVTDPVNSPKLFALGGVAVAALSVALYSGLQKEIIKNKIWFISLSVFLIFSVSTVMNSKAPFTQSIYGVYGRGNGFIMYLFLTLIALSATLLQAKSSFKLVLWGFLGAGAINVAYSLWVICFGDFLSWSNPYNAFLGTFGNPNFIGAFLGVFGSVICALGVAKVINWKLRVGIFLLFILTIFEIEKSHALQGYMVVAAGLAIVGFYFIRSQTKGWLITSFYLFSMIVVAFFTILGALRLGPLAQFIYKSSVSLRSEYWHAAWNMGSKHPWTGVGFDSYGDWYRISRNASALVSPGVNVLSNSAHNVPLDIFAFGGWPLVISYLWILVLAGTALLKITFRSRVYDPAFVAIAVAWIGFQLQSFISINQAGLAIWGWLLSGILIAYERSPKLTIENNVISKPVLKNKKQKRTKPAQKELIFTPNFIASVGMVIGLIIAVPPLSADIKWRSAQVSQNASNLEQALKSNYFNPPNSFKYFSSAQDFEKSKLYEYSYRTAKNGTSFNPNSFEAWKLLYLLQNSSPEDKSLALRNMQRLDPLNKKVLG